MDILYEIISKINWRKVKTLFISHRQIIVYHVTDQLYSRLDSDTISGVFVSFVVDTTRKQQNCIYRYHNALH